MCIPPTSRQTAVHKTRTHSTFLHLHYIQPQLRNDALSCCGTGHMTKCTRPFLSVFRGVEGQPIFVESVKRAWEQGYSGSSERDHVMNHYTVMHEICGHFCSHTFSHPPAGCWLGYINVVVLTATYAEPGNHKQPQGLHRTSYNCCPGSGYKNVMTTLY